MRVVGRILAERRLDDVLDRRATNEGREQVGTGSRWKFGRKFGRNSLALLGDSFKPWQ